ncbi:DUF421 domain-containing protein [Cytobacillus sp. Hm23]
MDYYHITIEIFFGFIALFLVTKMLGKSQITQITTFDFISALVLGELVGNALFDENTGLGQIIYSVAIWGLLIYTMEMITQKWKRTRAFLEGKPSIVINKGQINYNELKKNKLDINQLQHLLRTKDAFSIREVEYALLETDGTVNVLKKSKYAAPTRDDMNLSKENVVLSNTLISDGEVLWENLEEVGFDTNWLQGQIQVHGATKFSEILYAEWREGEGLHVQKY